MRAPLRLPFLITLALGLAACAAPAAQPGGRSPGSQPGGAEPARTVVAAVRVEPGTVAARPLRQEGVAPEANVAWNVHQWEYR